MNKKKIKSIGVGGTFDHFHAGHEHFLRFAAKLAHQVVIGVTDPKLTKKKELAYLVESYSVRKNSVFNFCKINNLNCLITKLDNEYGPTLDNSKIHALCVSEGTVPGAKKINQLRLKMRLHDLEVFVCPWFKTQNQTPLSSTAIRTGTTNRQGFLYKDLFKNDLTLNKKQRQYFAQPQGNVVDKPNKSSNLTVVVGDSSLEKFITKKWPFNIGIFDKRILRQPYSSPVIDQIKPNSTVINPAGIISTQLVKTLQDSLEQEYKYIFVEGEEDLAAVAMVMLAPLQSKIYYGQPHNGLVEMTVNEKRKEDFRKVLSNKIS